MSKSTWFFFLPQSRLQAGYSGKRNIERFQKRVSNLGTVSWKEEEYRGGRRSLKPGYSELDRGEERSLEEELVQGPTLSGEHTLVSLQLPVRADEHLVSMLELSVFNIICWAQLKGRVSVNNFF